MANLDIVVSAIDRTRGGLSSAGRNIDKAERKTGKLGAASKVAGLAIGGLAIAGVAAGVALVGNFLKTGDALDKMNKTTGIGIEDLQKYGFAAEQSGSSLETFSKGILKQARFLDDANSGLATSTDTLDALGLSVKDFEGLNPDQQFNVFADALSGVDDAGQKAALAQEIFGRAGAELLPLLSEGASGIAALTAEAEANGNIMSTKAAQSAAKFNDQLNVLKQKGLAVVQQAMAALIPVMLAVIDFIDKKVVPVIKEDLVPVFQEIARVVKEVWENVIGPTINFVWNNVIKPTFDFLVLYIGFHIEALKLLATIVKEVWENVIGPTINFVWNNVIKPIFDIAMIVINLHIAAIKLIGTIVKEVWETVIGPTIAFVWNNVIKPIFDNIKTVIEISQKAFQVYGDIISTVFDRVKSAIQTVWDIIKPIIKRITDAINTVSGAVDKVKGIADKVTGGLAGKAAGLLGFASGGTVPGPIGAPRLAIVHGGEQILTPQQQRNQQPPRPPNTPMVAYLQIDGETLGRFVLDKTNNGIRRGELII